MIGHALSGCSHSFMLAWQAGLSLTSDAYVCTSCCLSLLARHCLPMSIGSPQAAHSKVCHHRLTVDMTEQVVKKWTGLRIDSRLICISWDYMSQEVVEIWCSNAPGTDLTTPGATWTKEVGNRAQHRRTSLFIERADHGSRQGGH